MSEGEELSNKIKELGAAIAAAKAEKKPMEEWKPLLDEMLALKVCVVAKYFVSGRKLNGSSSANDVQ